MRKSLFKKLTLSHPKSVLLYLGGQTLLARLARSMALTLRLMLFKILIGFDIVRYKSSVGKFNLTRTDNGQSN